MVTAGSRYRHTDPHPHFPSAIKRVLDDKQAKSGSLKVALGGNGVVATVESEAGSEDTVSVDIADPADFRRMCECMGPFMNLLPCEHVHAMLNSLKAGPISRQAAIPTVESLTHAKLTWKACADVYTAMGSMQLPGTASLVETDLYSPEWMPVSINAAAVKAHLRRQQSKQQTKQHQRAGSGRIPSKGERGLDEIRKRRRLEQVRSSHEGPTVGTGLASESVAGEESGRQAESSAAAVKERKRVTCSACGAVGHNRSNMLCTRYKETKEKKRNEVRGSASV